MLNDIHAIVIRTVGFLPAQVNHRHQATNVIRTALQFVSNKTLIPIVPEIWTDQEREALTKVDGPDRGRSPDRTVVVATTVRAGLTSCFKSKRAPIASASHQRFETFGYSYEHFDHT